MGVLMVLENGDGLPLASCDECTPNTSLKLVMSRSDSSSDSDDSDELVLSSVGAGIGDCTHSSPVAGLAVLHRLCG